MLSADLLTINLNRIKTPEEIFDEAIKSKGLDTVSVKDADLYEAGLDAIKQALSIANVVGQSGQLKKFLHYVANASAYADRNKMNREAEELLNKLF